MQEPSGKRSINAHFKREGVLPAVIFGVILVVAAIGAIVGPWLFERLR